MEPKLSIIVPVYNMQKYLRRCLESLTNQTLTDIEIIIVNDGSLDQSAAIISEFEQRDYRIKTIHKNNEGVSKARNTGIQAATGNYIGFVDPDDWVDLNMYKNLYQEAIEKNADIVMCSYIRESDKFSIEKKFSLPEKVFFDNDTVHSKVLRRLVGPISKEIAAPEMLDAWGTVWSKIYRTKIIKEKNITFTDLKEIGTNEDSLFNIKAIYFANTFLFINFPFYHYWKTNSASVTSIYKPNLLHQWFKLYDYIEEFIEEKKMGEEFKKALNNRICLGTLGLGLNTVSKANQSSLFKKLGTIQVILTDQRIQSSFKHLELADFPLVWRAFYFCAKKRFALGFYLFLKSIEWLRTTVITR
jgi:glycosyltransferase involved in cell wall biosynthesis